MANEYVIRRGLVVSGSSDLSGSLTVRGLSAGSGNLISIGANGVLTNSFFSINQSVNSGSSPSFAGLTVNGNTTVTGNLTVSGTTTFINTTDIFIKDKLVVIASGSTTSADADGGGLFISGAAASITWSNGNSRMEFNKPLGITGAVSASSYAGSGASLTALNADNLASGTVPLARISGLTNSQLSGTAGITNANLANSSVTVNGTAISLGSSGTITANTTNTLTLGSGLTGTSFNGSSAVTATVNSGSMLAYYSSSIFTRVSGDITINNSTGVAAIGSGVIVNADINASAAIAVSKLAASTISGVTLGNNLNALTIGTGLSGTSYNGSSAVTVAIDSTVATLTGTQTLTNKTLTSPTITTPNFGSSNLTTTGDIQGDNVVSTGLMSANGGLTVVGSITSSGANSIISGSFSGSYIGDGSGLSGVAASFPTTPGTAPDINFKYYTQNGAAQSVYTTQTDLAVGLAGLGLSASSGRLDVNSGSLVAYYTGSTFSKVSGDITITSAGVAAIGSGVIVNADINASAAIAVSKLAASTISGVTLGNNLNALTLGNGLTGTSYNGSSAVTAAVSYGSTANTAVQGNTTITLNGTTNEIDVTGTAAQALGGSPSYTVGLADSITGTRTFTGDIVTTGDLLISGSGVQKSIIDKQQVGPSTIATLTQVAAVSVTNVDAVFFDYVIKQTTADMRAGTIMAVTNGSTVEFTETSTLDIGNTSMVTLSADINAGNVRLLALSPSGTWTIRTLVRTI
jgi:trimeric autotransporter adhesin